MTRRRAHPRIVAERAAAPDRQRRRPGPLRWIAVVADQRQRSMHADIDETAFFIGNVLHYPHFQSGLAGGVG